MSVKSDELKPHAKFPNDPKISFEDNPLALIGLIKLVNWSSDHVFNAPNIWIVFVVVIFNWDNWLGVKSSNNTLNFCMSESEIDPIFG